ncbi:hypothetical protein P7D31_09855 [Enterococcus dongliensis]|uniref:hypothetical protein n=1 Tax=Enterococcus dongliensis TaxID=2559925 RepID=UPI0028901626|nr:hypothetical protein [Enterococcus dongliensis]MDT2640419.1 hypothetical protein [Enterococcus dongliensis]
MMFNILSEEFLNRLRESVVSIVRDAFQIFLKEKSDERRYLQQKDAREYIGGINGKDFNQLVKDGLPEIQLGTSGKHKRYDKCAIDEFMLVHQKKGA